jgi:PAS domain S-box-containing protein
VKENCDGQAWTCRWFDFDQLPGQCVVAFAVPDGDTRRQGRWPAMMDVSAGNKTTAASGSAAGEPGDPFAVSLAAAGGRRGLWFVCALLIVTISVVAGVAIWQLRRQALSESQREMTNLGVVLAEQTSRTVQSVDLVLRDVQMHVAKLGPDTPDDFRARMTAENAHRYLATHLENLPQAETLALVDANGALLAWSRDGPVPPMDFSDREYFRFLRDHNDPGAVIAGPTAGRVSGRWLMLILRRITGPDGAFLGVVAGLIDTKYLEDFYQTIRMLPGEQVSLLRRDGTVIAGQPDIDGFRGHRMPDRSPWFDLVSKGGGSYRSPGYFVPVPQIVTVHPLRDYPLVVDVNVSDRAALGGWRRNTVAILAAAFSVALGFAALFRVLADHFRGREAYACQLVRGAEMLRASERRFRDFATTSSDWFWEQDADLRFTEIGAETSPGPPGGGSHIGKRWHELNEANPEPGRWAEHTRDLLARESFRDFNFSLSGPGGEPHHVSVNGVPVYDDAGQFAGYRGTGSDITERIEAERALRQAKERAEQAEALLRDAVDSISADFVIYDREDRFVMCNETYRQTFRRNFGGGSELLVPGARYVDIVRQIYGRIEGNTDAAEDEEAWIAMRLARHREIRDSLEQQLDDGSWFLVTDRRMNNGGTAGLRIDITALKQAQMALRESEARLDRAQEIAGIGSWELDIPGGKYIWSRQFYRLRGKPLDFIPTRESVAAGIHAEDLPAMSRWVAALQAGQEREPIEMRVAHPDGRERIFRAEGRAVIEPDGTIRRIMGTVQDITEQRLIERQLAQAQKMEAIGNLTGGMAHDFNNVLGIIIGNLDLLGQSITGDREAAELCDDARDGALRCADLIRRLLAFARRQPLRPERTNVNELVEGLVKMLRRILGEDIELVTELDPDVWLTIADPAQLESALTNLATNARDAMPRGGRLVIGTSNAQLDDMYVEQQPGVTPGEYVLIEVSDTGTGIEPALIDRIYEPFFTTKEPGYGTGLGLSMVFGFVKQSEGHVAVYSEPGRGTTFRVYLPRTVSDSVAVVANPRPAVGGNELVLVVEDNARLRRAAVRQLNALGYRTLEAENADAALRVLAEQSHVDLLFTDVIMPGELDGLDLAREATRRAPALRVLLTSGFPDLRRGGDRLTNSGFQLLSKPYHQALLARALRQVLDGHAAPVGQQTREPV